MFEYAASPHQCAREYVRAAVRRGARARRITSTSSQRTAGVPALQGKSQLLSYVRQATQAGGRAAPRGPPHGAQHRHPSAAARIRAPHMPTTPTRPTAPHQGASQLAYAALPPRPSNMHQPARTTRTPDRATATHDPRNAQTTRPSQASKPNTENRSAPNTSSCHRERPPSAACTTPPPHNMPKHPPPPKPTHASTHRPLRQRTCATRASGGHQTRRKAAVRARSHEPRQARRGRQIKSKGGSRATLCARGIARSARPPRRRPHAWR